MRQTLAMTNIASKGATFEPEYSSYTTSELLDVEKRIDGEKFPDRFGRIQDEIAKRRNAGEFSEPTSKVYPPDSEKLIRRIRIGAAVNLMYAFTILGFILFSILSSDKLHGGADPPGLSLIFAAVVMQLGLVVISYAFYALEYWPRLVLWPTSVLAVLTGSFLASLVSLFTIWVLFSTRPQPNSERASAA